MGYLEKELSSEDKQEQMGLIMGTPQQVGPKGPCQVPDTL